MDSSKAEARTRDDRTYIRVHDGMPDHPKIIAAGGDAGWLWMCGNCYCGKQLTDGRIPKALVPRLSDRRQPMRLAARLCEVGLWEDRGDHYLVHDYLEHNRSAEEVDTLKAKRREAGSRGGKAKASARANGKQVLEQTLSKMPSKSLPDTDTDTDTYSHPQTTVSGSEPTTDDDEEQQQPKRDRPERLVRAEAACALIGLQDHQAAVARGVVLRPEPHLKACRRQALDAFLAAAQLLAHNEPKLTVEELAAQLTVADTVGPTTEPPVSALYAEAEERRQERIAEGPSSQDRNTNLSGVAAARAALLTTEETA